MDSGAEMKKLQINIFDNAFVWHGMIEEIESLVLRSSWAEIVNSELKVSKYVVNFGELQLGRMLVINNQWDKVCIIEDMNTSLKENVWTFTLIPLKGILNYRIVKGNDALVEGNTLFTNKPQERVASGLIWYQCVVHSDTARNFPKVNAPVYKQIGISIDYTTKDNWKPLGDAVVDICKMSKPFMGWNFVLTLNTNGTIKEIFYDFWLPTDRTIDQVIVPPVVFSEMYENIENVTYEESMKEWRNVSYTKWNNGTTDYLTEHILTDEGSATGFNRKEILFNSQQKTTAGTANDSISQLRNYPKIKSFTADVLNNENTMSTYKTDWNLGDIVTIQSKAIKNNQLITMNAQITQIEEIYENGLYNLNVMFGEAKPSFIKLIKNEIRKKGV